MFSNLHDCASLSDTHLSEAPFGQVVSQTGTFADQNNILFSTKYWDREVHPAGTSTGLGCWTYRWSNGERWISRDPMGEEGGENLYGFVSNNAIKSSDPFGLQIPVEEIPWHPIPEGWKVIEGGKCCAGQPLEAPSPSCLAKCVRIFGAFISVFLCPTEAIAPESAPYLGPDVPPLPDPQPKPDIPPPPDPPKRCPPGWVTSDRYPFPNAVACAVVSWIDDRPALGSKKRAVTCGAGGGWHYNAYRRQIGSKFLGSVLCCNWCDNTPTGPRFGMGCKSQ